MANINSLQPTGRGLVTFLNFVSERGLMNANTAGALRAATREVLSAAEPDGWEEIDLTTIDVEDYAQRFERLRAGKLKPDSLSVYKSRFRNAVQMFREYLSNPSAWRYRPERPAAARKKTVATTTEHGIPDIPTSPSTPTTPHRASTIEYPFPLRPGLVASLRLPVDLTKAESKRLSAFIDSLAFQEPTSTEPQDVK